MPFVTPLSRLPTPVPPGNPALKMEQWCIDNQEMLRAQLDRDPFAEAKPKAKLGAAPGGGSSGADGGAGKGAQQAEEQQQAEQQRQQAQAPEVPALQTAEQRNGAMAPAAGQRAAAVEQQQAAPRHPPTPREAATAALPALPTVSAEPRPPQREEAGVSARACGACPRHSSRTACGSLVYRPLHFSLICTFSCNLASCRWTL